MIVVPPITITDGILTSNIPEPDTGEIVWSAGTYNAGDEVIKVSTHRKYRATTTTTDDPEAGVLADPPTWVDIGSTNKFAMFDGVIGSQSVEADSIVVDITAGQLVNAVAGFGLSASTVNITVDDPIEGEVYNQDVQLRDNSAVVDYYEYFFSPIVERTNFVLLDLPPFPSATVTVTIDKAGDDAKAGELVLGRQINLGVAEYGTSMKNLDFSIKERDEFGNFTIVRRRTSKLVDFDAYCDTSKVGYVYKELDKLSTVSCVWTGEPDRNDDPTLVYGYYKTMTINISNPSTSAVTVQVEGLV